jgi:hypothetical protein
MKRILLATSIAFCLVATSALAASYRGSNSAQCSYSPLQDLIRNARSAKDLEPILGGRVDLNAPVKCGGTILQLAIRRGNPEVVRLLLESGISVKDEVSLDGFDILGAPNKVPLLMFAAYYSPRQDILKLIISAGADMTVLDANGENVLWYLNKNPVLQNTNISDSIKNALLFNFQSNEVLKNNTGSNASVQQNQVVGAASVQVPQNAQSSAQVIMTKQADGSVGVPPELVQAISAAAGSDVPQIRQVPREIIEPDMKIK